MSKHIPLKITIQLANKNVILANNPTDGIIARLYFDMQKEEGVFNGDYSQKLKFLTMSDGIYHCSNPIYKINYIDNDFLTKNFDNNMFEELGDKPHTASVHNKLSGRYKSWLESYETTNVDKVHFYIHANFEMIEKLFTNLRYIGKKASLGYGKIKKITLEEIDEDYSLVKDNQAMRHLPNIDKYSNLENKNKALMVLTHPYWKNSNNKDICILSERRYF
jgi:CRISPR type IV-associated protein Csf3